MSKASKVKVPKEATRKHLARAEREARQRLWLILGLTTALVLAIGLVAYGFLDERVLKQREPVATVNGTHITTAEFQKRFRFEVFQLNRQLADLESQRQMFGGESSLAFFVQQIDQQITSLQSLLTNPSLLGKRVLDGMIEDELVRQEAAKRQISVSAQEVATNIEQSYDFYRVPPTPTPEPTVTSTPVASPTPMPSPTVSLTPTSTPEPTETPAPTATPVTEAAFNTAFNGFLNQIATTGFTREDVNRLVETNLLRAKLQDEFNKQVPTTAEQIQFRVIVFEVDEQAQDAEKQLKSGASFDELYQRVESGAIVSATTSNQPWMLIEELKQNYPPTLGDLVLSLGISQTSQIITDTQVPGSMIFQQTGRGVQPLSSSQLSAQQQKLYQDWVNQQLTGPGINLYNSRYLTRIPTK